MDESPNLLNPASGWLYNSNNLPWSAAGESSPKQSAYPKYVDNGVESARGLHAIKVLKDKKNFTVDSLVSAAYDNDLTWFDLDLAAVIQSMGRGAGRRSAQGHHRRTGCAAAHVGSTLVGNVGADLDRGLLG